MTSNKDLDTNLPFRDFPGIPAVWNDDPSAQLRALLIEVAAHRNSPTEATPDFMVNAWRALDQLPPDHNPRGRVEAMLHIARFFYHQDQAQLMVESAASALRAAVEGQHPTLEAQAQTALGTALIVVWDFVGAMQALASALEITQQQGDALTEVKTLNELGNVLYTAGLYSESLAMYERVIHFYEDRGDDERSALISMNAAAAALEMGDLKRAGGFVEVAKGRGRKEQRTADEQFWLVQSSWIQCEVLIQSGLAEEALQVVQAAEPTALASGLSTSISQIAILQAVARYANGLATRDELGSVIARARHELPSLYSDALRIAIRAYEQVGEVDNALDLYRQLVKLYTERKFEQVRESLGRPSPDEAIGAARLAQLSLAIDRTITELVNTAVTQSLRAGLDDGRIFRVSRLAELFAAFECFPKAQVDHISLGAKLIDIGNMVVPSDLLGRRRQLTDDELAIVGTHVTVGADLLLSTKLSSLEQCAAIVRFHHERWDGAGPCGLRSAEILPAAQIVALSDCFDALTHDRPWRPAVSMSDALECIKSDSGKHFEPMMAERFVRFVQRESKKTPDWEAFLSTDALENDFIRTRKRISEIVEKSLVR